MQSAEHSMVLREGIVTTEVQHDLDKLGIAKNSGEEKLRARAAKIKQDEENVRMAKLYRQHVLKEQPTPDLVPLGSIQLAPKPVAKVAPVERVEEREEVGSFGD